MKLSILIPTYNRCKDLEHNVATLTSFIADLPNPEDVCIIISDNASTDDTNSIITKLKEKALVNIQYLRQETNIGYSKNVCALMSVAQTDWVMLLGDDDYLEPWYIGECLKQIKEHPNLGCIIPNNIAYNPIMKKYGSTREPADDSILYFNAGYEACLHTSYLGHSLSGLCFRNTDVIKKYRANKMNNLYPQIYFVAYNALKFDVLHFMKVCLTVSDIPQTQKDWKYGDDGLINDIFENYKYLELTKKQRAQLEAEFLQNDPRYEWTGNDKNLIIENILQGKNVSYIGRYYIAKQIVDRKDYNGRKLRIPLTTLAYWLKLKRGIKRFLKNK